MEPAEADCAPLRMEASAIMYVLSPCQPQVPSTANIVIHSLMVLATQELRTSTLCLTPRGVVQQQKVSKLPLCGL